MNGKTLSLPPEIVTLILRNLHLDDLCRCRLVNTSFNILVRPLLSRFLFFTDAGMTDSPTSPQVVTHRQYPDIRTLQLPSAEFEYIAVRWHSTWAQSGRCLFGVLASSLITSCRVLNVGLGRPADKSCLASAHPRAELRDAHSAHPPLSHPTDCHVLRTLLGNTAVDKLVLKNVPIAYAAVDPDILSVKTSQTIQEAVIVFDAASMSDANLEGISIWNNYYTCQEAPLPCFDDGRLTFHELNPILPPNAKDFTLVFWTSQPAMEFATWCCSARDDLMAGSGGRPPCCTCPLSSPSHDYDFDSHYSCWEDDFLNEMTEALAAHAVQTSIRKITIVNASAIVPDGADRKQALFAISTGVAKHDIFRSRFLKALQAQLGARLGPDEAKRIMDSVEFKYMKDWLSASAWEDVFDAKEVKPWMDFKRHAQITDWFKPESPDNVKWRKEVDGRERVKLIHRRTIARCLKPSKNNWRN